MSSAAVRSWSNDCDFASDEWITAEASSEQNQDSWTEAPPVPSSRRANPVVAALAERRLRSVSEDQSNLVAGYVDQETDSDLDEAIDSVVLGWGD